MPQHLDHRAVAQALSRAGGIGGAALGAVVLAGWWLHIQWLKEILPGLATMKVNTALCFVAAGTAVALLDGGRSTDRGLAIRALAFFVLVVTAATLAEYVTGMNFGIDEVFHPDDPNAGATSHPGRMAPGTGFAFMFLGLSLLASTRSSARFVRSLASVTMVVALLAVIGYVYGVRELYTISAYSSMALHTATGLLVLSLSLMGAHTRDGFMGVLTSDSSGGFTARALLPVTTVTLVAIGWVRLSGERAGFYGPGFGVTLMVVSAMAVTSGAVIWHAIRLHNADLQRRDAEAGLRVLAESLEVRVEERTAELRQALAEVQQLSGLLPICAWCKSIRDDQNYWHTLEAYLATHTQARFTHGMCPTCYAKMLRENPSLDDERGPVVQASATNEVPGPV